jgi:surfactin synthase thioesterase subunit
MRLFCFPYSGGSQLAYAAWSNFGDGVEVVGVDYPGHLLRPREKLARSMDDLVERLTAELADRWDRPFALMGASLGGLVAFELARVAEAAGTPPTAVIVTSCAAPSLLHKHAPIAGLADEAFVRAFAERYGGLKPEILADPSALALILPMARADKELFEDYAARSHAPIASDILAVGGADDRAAPLDAVAAWREFSTGAVRIASVPGGHFFAEERPEAMMEMVRTLLQAKDSAHR